MRGDLSPPTKRIPFKRALYPLIMSSLLSKQIVCDLAPQIQNTPPINICILNYYIILIFRLFR